MRRSEGMNRRRGSGGETTEAGGGQRGRRGCAEIEERKKIEKSRSSPSPDVLSRSLTAYCKTSFTLSFTSPSFYIGLFIHLYI